MNEQRMYPHQFAPFQQVSYPRMIAPLQGPPLSINNQVSRVDLAQRNLFLAQSRNPSQNYQNYTAIISNRRSEGYRQGYREGYEQSLRQYYRERSRQREEQLRSLRRTIRQMRENQYNPSRIQAYLLTGFCCNFSGSLAASFVFNFIFGAFL